MKSQEEEGPPELGQEGNCRGHGAKKELARRVGRGAIRSNLTPLLTPGGRVLRCPVGTRPSGQTPPSMGRSLKKAPHPPPRSGQMSSLRRRRTLCPPAGLYAGGWGRAVLITASVSLVDCARGRDSALPSARHRAMEMPAQYLAQRSPGCPSAPFGARRRPPASGSLQSNARAEPRAHTLRMARGSGNGGGRRRAGRAETGFPA